MSAFAAHAAAVVVKRVVRRSRPDEDRVQVLVGTPSALSFPSAHATSTAAAAAALVPLVGWGPASGVLGVMGLSRVLLGVHFPFDVLAGCALGATVERLARVVVAR
ncbi:phosphatase PAP2 family protein [Actinotalea sp. K2]|nr:phosphatase PAP2 family protein [Actinotalea sp. K2]